MLPLLSLRRPADTHWEAYRGCMQGALLLELALTAGSSLVDDWGGGLLYVTEKLNDG